MAKFFITTPIYYVNDVPHIGHAYTTIAADVVARYHRLKGDDVFFLTGTDEHGAKIAEAAEAHGQTPREFVDSIASRFQTAWRELDISHDYYVRTSDQRHVDGARRLLSRLYEAGAIYKGIYSGKYCVGCERFLAEDELTADGLCPDHLKPPIPYSEENYFFKLSSYRETLIRAISNPLDRNHYEIEPPARRNEILGKLRSELHDLSISRASVKWGIPLPWDESQTCYVWFEALMNYVTAIGFADEPDTFATYWPADIHLMAKEILWFHSVIWPAMLIATGLPVPRKVYAHGFFTLNGRKMSKTLGNVIAPRELVDRYGADASRYLLLSEFPFGIDGNVSIDSFNVRYNADLANDLGNLVNRAVSMANRYFDGTIPIGAVSATDVDRDLASVCAALSAIVSRALDGLEFSTAAESIRGAVARTNRYIDTMQPWALAKSDRERLAIVLAHVLEALRLIGTVLRPFIPNRAESLLRQIGVDPANPGATAWTADRPITRVTERPEPLFPRLES
ncbi:MAG: methionine--tRNA ligase [Chloroflexota bacterium]|nr:MAG: methionine--tRNA ligase [Chloroflexota bacterium]